ncbi:hypothetical protein AVEN_223454-1 [Araneus ventricosus]|uniref:Transposable element Tc3 transposase n=1 Tax=Araneus ventricosus TaxID=182803 RepID=A0A4Y2ERX8_ARAVE|nr:hypothetical protein AVEN_223454-1 [Araneus ventricosus]
MFSRQHGGGSLMVWGVICFNGQISLAFLSDRQQYDNCQETLSNYLLPFGELLDGTNWTFQHDKVSIHVSKSTPQCLKSSMVSVLNRPALSPDFHDIENVWGIITL